jgi:hypothetical protein
MSGQRFQMAMCLSFAAGWLSAVLFDVVWTWLA